MLFSFTPLTQAKGVMENPLQSLVRMVIVPTRPYFDYIARAGDTIESLAAQFHRRGGGHL